MTQEKLKSLRLEDFQAPNKVLCYGGGGAFQSVAPYMLACGIDIIGIIDAHKQGTVTIRGKELSYMSLDKAVELYGNDAVIIITIANMGVFQQVRQTLIERRFSEDRIFDLNFWTWLTTPSEKSYCGELGGYVQFMPAALSQCCNIGVVDAYLCEWFIEGRPLRESMENFLAKRSHYIEESKRGRIPLYCRNCDFLTREPDKNSETVTQFIISDHAFCNADCVYCCDACSIPRKKVGATVEERYAAILWVLEELQRRGLLHEQAVVQLAGGEITINPYKEKIYEAVKRVIGQLPGLQLQIFSNCFIYEQEIADLLRIGRSSFLQCDLDAGTPETYIKVKGFNRFDVVCENLKKYAQYGTVKLKYIILPGWNDSQADYEGTVAILKGLRLNELMLSPEFGASREGDRAKIREVLFSTARFMALLGDNGIQAVLPEPFWKKEDIAVARRLCGELRIS